MLQLIMLSLATSAAVLPPDPYLYLEEREGKQALEWVQQQNDKTLSTLGQTPEFAWALEQMNDLYNAKDRVRFAHYRYGNFWLHFQDATHVQGQLRRMSLNEYKKDEPAYDVVLDFDELSAQAHEKYVYKGKTHLDRFSSRV